MEICRWRFVALLLVGVASLAGCGESSSSHPDTGSDTGSNGGVGGSGAGGGAGSDASATDLGGDTASDARSDAGGDAAPGDVRADGPPEVRADTGGDGAVEGPETGDGGADAPADGGADTTPPRDGGGDLPADGGADTGAANDAGPPESYVAVLTGAEQVPPVDTAASGSASLSYDPRTHLLSWTLTHSIAAATGAHIHTAGAGDTGVATITLAVATSTTGSVTLDAPQEADLRLGHLYIDVHSSAAIDGEIRGQILRPGETLWVARLNGAEEVPVNQSAGTAAISLIVNSAHTSAHYRLVVTSLVPMGGHIHTGVAGDPGTVRTAFTFVGTTTEADFSIDATDFSLLDQTRLFANVHTAAFGGGEIRGQLLRAGSRFWVSRMTGDQEVPAVSSAGTGNASVAVDYRSTLVRYAVTTSLTPTMAHIHPGIAGVAAAPILTFTNLATTFAGTGTLTQAQVDALVAGRLYTNIHTAAFPDGEIRGQLLRPGERLFAAALSGGNEVPPITSVASGAMQLVLNAAATSLRYESVVTGLGDATSAFMVNGPAGAAGGTPVATLMLVGINPIGTQAVTATDVTNLRASMYYVDVHSSLHPEGEIRGQIVPR